MLAAFHHALVALRHASSVVVCAHVRPDGDAVGSVLGMTLALRENGIPAVPTLANVEDPPSTYAFLPGFGLYVPAEQLEAPDVFVAMDSPNVGPTRPRRAAGAGRQDGHRLRPPSRRQPTTAPSTSSTRRPSATAQLVWQFAKTLGAPSSDVAECCYVGLVTDTGRFSYDNTSAAALRDAADMVDAGVSPARDLAPRLPEPLGGLARDRVARAVAAHPGQSTAASPTRGSATPTSPSSTCCPRRPRTCPTPSGCIGGIDAAVLLRQHGDEVRVNLRSKTGADVGASPSTSAAAATRRRRASRTKATSTTLLAGPAAACSPVATRRERQARRRPTCPASCSSTSPPE